MAYKVIIGLIAQGDLAQIHDYIAKENPEAARAFTEHLLAEARALKTFPNRGGHLKDCPGVRFTVVARYLIIYRVVAGKREVHILSFWHTAREQRPS